MSSSEQQRLQNEITELRGELGETVEALVHKVDVPARAKERGSELANRPSDAALSCISKWWTVAVTSVIA